MKLLVELPTWLGDAVMATPAIENLFGNFKDLEITIVGSFVSTQIFVKDNRIKNIIVDNTKKDKNRYKSIYELSKKIGKHDLAVSFRSSFASKILFLFTKTKKRFFFNKNKVSGHQVVKYNNFINKILKTNLEPGDLKLNFKSFEYSKPTLGINPGATYGSAKRWYPEEFSKVAISLAKKYNIAIFGGPSEISIAKDIEKELLKNGIKNFENLAGKTTIPELIEKIAGLSVFITNDSGPMHLAAAFKVKTVAIFGPTNFKETNQWNNPEGYIVSKNLNCSPCMKRVCPLKHHNCMKLIKANDVLKFLT